MDRKRLALLFSTLVLPLLILLLRPLDITLRQSAVLAILVLVILWWVTAVVERTVAAVVLVAAFLLFSGTPAQTVFTFPLSENFWLVALSFLFSHGISQSGLADRLISPALARLCTTPLRLMCAMFLAVLLMTFVMPQPFSRAIVLMGIFSGYFERAELSMPLRSALFILLFTFSILTGSLFQRGDLILNQALPTLGGVEMSEAIWCGYMTIPTLLLILLTAALFYLIYRKTLGTYHPPATVGEHAPLSRLDRLRLALILGVVLFWALEGIHGVPGVITVAAGTALMFPTGLLRLRDVKAVNLKLLVFLTGAFSIGGVLKACGVADLVFSRFTPLFPGTFSLGYIAIAVLSSVVLHGLLGSNITTMSVAIPGLLAIGAGTAPTLPLLFLVFMSICGQLFFPFQNTAFVVGEGSGCFTARELLRFMLPMTVLALLVFIFLYPAYWRMVGLL